MLWLWHITLPLLSAFLYCRGASDISHLAVCALTFIGAPDSGPVPGNPENTNGVVGAGGRPAGVTLAQPQWGFAWKKPANALGYCRGGRHFPQHLAEDIAPIAAAGQTGL